MLCFLIMDTPDILVCVTKIVYYISSPHTFSFNRKFRNAAGRDLHSEAALVRYPFDFN